MKFELSNGNLNFGKLDSATMSLTASQYLKAFFCKIGGDANEMFLFFNVI